MTDSFLYLDERVSPWVRQVTPVAPGEGQVCGTDDDSIHQRHRKPGQIAGCGEYKPFVDPKTGEPNFRKGDGKNGYYTICLACERPQNLERRLNALKDDNYWFKVKREQDYKLTRTRHDEMVKQQGGGCALCGVSITDLRKWNVDHDHNCCPVGRGSCGVCVRALLCRRCNIGLGRHYDDPLTLRRAADLIESGSIRPRDGFSQPDLLRKAADYVEFHRARIETEKAGGR